MADKRKECKLSIAAVDKYSSPLGIDIRLHPWGKEDWRISFLMRNELIGQVVQRNYITFKSYKKASDVFSHIEEKMLSFQDSIERGFVHSVLAIPQIGKFMEKLQEIESDYEQPDSPSLRQRSDHSSKYNNEDKPDGLVIHDVEGHFPAHNGELEEKPKPEKKKSADIENEIVEAQIEELDIDISPIDNIEEFVEQEPEFNIEESVIIEQEPEFNIEESVNIEQEPEFNIEESASIEPEPEPEPELEPEPEPEPELFPAKELEAALASLETMFFKESAEKEPEFEFEDIGIADLFDEAQIEQEDIFVTLLASLGDLDNIVLSSPIRPRNKRSSIKSEWFNPQEEFIQEKSKKQDIYFDFDIEEEDMLVIDFNDPKYKNIDIPDMTMLEAEALKYDNFEDFKRAWLQENKHGLYWHVTDDPKFFIDPEKGPRDMSSLALANPESERFMITSDLENWAEHHGDERRFAALIDMSEVPKGGYRQVFGGEFFVNDPSKSNVIKVYPLDEALYIDMEYAENKPKDEKELKALYEIAHRRENTLHNKKAHCYRPLKYSEYNTPIRAKIGAAQDLEEKDEISKVRFVIESISSKPDFKKIKLILADDVWYNDLFRHYNQCPEFCLQTYNELLEEMLNEEVVAFTGGLIKTSQEVVDMQTMQEMPQETDLGPVNEAINIEQIRPNVDDFGADAGKADAAINLIQKSSLSHVLNGINWIGVSDDPGHFGVYETNLNGKGFRINIGRVNKEVEELVSEFKAQLEGVQIQNVGDDQAEILNNQFGGPNLTWEPNDININLDEAKEDIQVIILGEVMVHEATHAMGAEDESAPTEAEKAFLREIIPAVNQDRENRGLIPIPIGVKGEDKTTVNEFLSTSNSKNLFIKKSGIDYDLPESVKNNPELADQIEDLEGRYFPEEYAQDKEDIQDDMTQPGASGVAYIDETDGKIKGYLYGYDLVYEDNIEDLNLDLSQMICFAPMLCNLGFMTFVAEIINKAKGGEIFYVSNFSIDEAHRFRAKQIIGAFFDQIRERGYEYVGFDALSDTYRLIMRGDRPNESREKAFGVKVVGSLPIDESRSLFLMKV